MTGKKVVFTVQGEGRGHLTQAITVQNILLKAGYEIACVMVGTSGVRKLPGFFYQRIQAPILKFESPNFVRDSKRKSVKLGPSILFNLKLLPKYFQNMRHVDRTLKEIKPDLVINFYDPLIGMYFGIFNPGIRLVCIAHQYVYHHPDFQFPEKAFFFKKIGLKMFTRLTNFRADKKLALSLYPMVDYPKNDVYIIPPLLRQAVYEANVKQGDYILVYLLNQGYMEEIIDWHNKYPDVTLHCFTDKEGIEGEWKYDDTLTFHQINDQKFLDLMAQCKAFSCTSGFESVCEALYFGKPVLMVPVEGQFEQYSNALDASKIGAGIYDRHFNLNQLLEYLPKHKTDPQVFRNWASGTADLLIQHLESIN